MSDKALPVLGSIVHFHVEGAHGTASEPKLGRCVEVSFDRYLVKTTEGLLADVPSCNVALYRHVAPEHGGFDVVWPDAVETVEIFAELVVKCVQLKGYCVIQMFGSEDDRYNAKAMALNMPGFGRLHPEFEESYLGRELETKLTWVDSGDGFEKYIDDLISLGGLLMPIVEEHLGFSPSPERLSTMLRVPFEGKAEKEELRPLVLSNEDIEGGEVERFLAFVKNRRLCFMSFVDGSGIVALHPKTEMSLDPVTLPVGANRMLIFRHDLMGYSYFPGKDDIVLQAWLLEERQVIELNEITGTPTKVDSVRNITKRVDVDTSVHVVGRGIRACANMEDPATFFSAMEVGTDCFVQFPLARWDMDDYAPPADDGWSVTRHTALLSEEMSTSIDNKFFGISDEHAGALHPHQRHGLEVGYTILYDGGYTRETLRNARISVFFADLGADTNFMYHGETGHPESFWGSDRMVTACRMSHIFGMTGHTQCVDTACSSTTVATHLVHSHLTSLDEHGRQREKAGISIGAQAYTNPMGFVGLSAAHMLSSKGRSRTFDQSASGYARGEGAAGVLFKAKDQVTSLQHVAATLLGTAVNQDGRSASLTAPNGPSQTACVMMCMVEAQLHTDSVQKYECHGTGTALGDPIEVGSCRAVMSKRSVPLSQHSGKSNHGHLEGVAGAMAQLKTMLEVRWQVGPPNAHLRQLNGHMDISGYPILFPVESADLGQDEGIGGLSSFGFGGTNSHANFWVQSTRAKPRQIQLEALDVITVPCPSCMGNMCWLCNVAVPQFAAPEKHHCSTIRDESATYDLCSRCCDRHHIRHKAFKDTTSLSLGS